MTVVAYAVGAILAVAAVIRDRSSLGTVFPLVVTAATLAIVVVIVIIQRRANLRRTIAEIRRPNQSSPRG
jgi:sugar phosphate permease